MFCGKFGGKNGKFFEDGKKILRCKTGFPDGFSKFRELLTNF
jgi:hypothetical protein